MACGFFVEISEHVDAEDKHGKGESDEAMCRTEERPVASEKAAEDGELGNQEEHYWRSVQAAAFVGTLGHTAGDGCENMSDSIEEEELGSHRGLDEHDHAGGDDCQETDDVQDTNSVEDDIAWAG